MLFILKSIYIFLHFENKNAISIEIAQTYI